MNSQTLESINRIKTLQALKTKKPILDSSSPFSSEAMKASIRFTTKCHLLIRICYPCLSWDAEADRALFTCCEYFLGLHRQDAISQNVTMFHKALQWQNPKNNNFKILSQQD